MDRLELHGMLSGLLEASGDNTLPPDAAQYPGAAGTPIFDAPLMGVASASDPIFNELLRHGVIGPHHMPPAAWLPGAMSVISFFFPFSDEVRRSNRVEMSIPSAGWLYARIEGQALINRLMAELALTLASSGNRCVVPSLDARFWSKTSEKVPHHPGLTYTSPWSERHVAFICGLGTFGLSKGLITKRGSAGRLASIITGLMLEPDVRDYNGITDYCSMCGRCAVNCPAGAITLEHGKDHAKCSAFLDRTLEAFSPRYGCGKCQVGVPCEQMIPDKRR